MPKKFKMNEYRCDKCQKSWSLEALKVAGVVKCVCGETAIHIIQHQHRKRKSMFQKKPYNHGGDNFDPSPWDENNVRILEDG